MGPTEHWIVFWINLNLHIIMIHHITYIWCTLDWLVLTCIQFIFHIGAGINRWQRIGSKRVWKLICKTFISKCCFTLYTTIFSLQILQQMVFKCTQLQSIVNFFTLYSFRDSTPYILRPYFVCTLYLNLYTGITELIHVKHYSTSFVVLIVEKKILHT